VTITGLRKRYGTVQAVAGVDVRIVPGEVVALLGPNGAGKSTTIDMLLGLTPPDEGAVRLWGLPPAEACRRGYVGAMLQTGGLLGGVTVREMVELMRGLAPDPLPIDDVIATARIRDIVDQRADRLSGGQTQRVRFALAIAGNPQLLVLDEPTVAMDVATRRAFWAAMRAWTARGRTVLFATHYLEEADAYADRAVLMAGGRVVADGPTTEVKAAVGGRTIRATVPGVDADELRLLPGVSTVEQHGAVMILRCVDSDAALRALLEGFPAARDFEVTGAGLEEAFLALTTAPNAEEVLA
jgi:ABC-2 type transport system ATP-binding protein